MKKTVTKQPPKWPLYWQLALAMILALLQFRISANAQFTIKENFKGNQIESSDIIVGGSPSAYLTSGIDDPINNGWLRVTKAADNQKGFAYINKSFPSSLGVFIDFEYTSWADAKAQYGGADGFSIYLFDAQYGPGSFGLGGYGGSLGYANFRKSGEPTQAGLRGGYIGVGIDEFGNFSNPTEGRNGGLGSRPNAIVFRGPTTSNKATTNKYLAGTSLDTGSSVYYKPIVSNRPTAGQFYRRIQIQIDPIAGGQYRIQFRWATTVGGSFTKILEYTTSTPPPALMKVGFAASTGLGFNYHEIRNLIVTTPGGLRIDKQVNKASASVGDQLKYTINVSNATTADLTGLMLRDTLRDGTGNLLPADAYQLDSIVFNNNGNPKNVLSDKNINGSIFNARLAMGAATLDNSTQATITTYITVKQRPEGGVISNAAFIDPTGSGITDGDLTNNYSKIQSSIIATDLSIQASHSNPIYQGDQNQILTLNVKNSGPDATSTTTAITDTLPAGFIFVGAEGNGWTTSVSGGIVTAIYNGAVKAGNAFPPLLLKVNVPVNQQVPVENKGVVRIATDEDTTNNVFIDPIQINQFSAGQISADQTIQKGATPETLTQISPASSTTGSTLTHQWQISQDGQHWVNVTGATEQSYQPDIPIGIGSTYYRRLDNAMDRALDPIATNVVKLTVNEGTVPVKLDKFDGYYQGGFNKLVWHTATETNNKGFEVYRSLDQGTSWTKQTFIPGKGTTTSPSKYYFEEPVTTGVQRTQYKLRIINQNGGFAWSETRSIQAPQAALTNAQLYPNPANDFIYITGITGPINIFDVAGRQIGTYRSLSKDQPFKIDIRGWAKGGYFVKAGGMRFKLIKK